MKRPEQALQRRICDELLRPLERDGRLSFYAVPNGGWRSPVEAGIMVGQGVRAGIPDLVVLLPGGRSIYAELKADKGRLSPRQALWRDRLQELGFAWCLVKSVEDMQAALVLAQVPMAGAA